MRSRNRIAFKPDTALAITLGAGILGAYELIFGAPLTKGLLGFFID